MFTYEIPFQADGCRLFSTVAHWPWSVLLDSCQSPYGRYDIIAVKPKITLQTRNGVTQIRTEKSCSYSRENPFAILQALLPIHYTPADLPFHGGAIGYFSYDLGRCIEKMPNIAINDCPIPEMALGIYDTFVVTDHQQKRSFFRTQDPQISFMNIFKAAQAETVPAFRLTSPFQSNMSREYYARAYKKIKHYLYEGDCYQVNLAQRFQATFTGSPWHAYWRLREENPAPFAAFMNLPDTCVLSLSPERFLLCDQKNVETKPVKGTRPRIQHDGQADKAMRRALAESSKDKAENLMIVDLLRNDLGKNCAYGSIKVPKLFDLESFANVHHLVSTITGQLADDKNYFDLLKGCFPGGSITGAPKIRAMEIIEELEPHRRQLYCGSIGYISRHGRMDMNIAIRSLHTFKNHIYCSGGGGLVADSEETEEYQETLTKVNVILKTLADL